MSIKLFNGLIAIGDILTETYYRKSRATSEAKQELGLDPEKDYDASIGISTVDEYVVMSIGQVTQGDVAVFDLAQFEQPLILKSLYIDNANQDAVVIEVLASVVGYQEIVNYRPLLQQTFNRNKTPVAFPDAPLPPNVRLRITAKTDISYMQLAFKPCSIIATAQGEIEVTEGAVA